MSNYPCADLEVTSLATASHGTSRLRIRSRNERRSVEISQFLSAQSGSKTRDGEWTKKVLPASPDIPGLISKLDERSLGRLELDGLARLGQFMEFCDTVEPLLRTKARVATADNSQSTLRKGDAFTPLRSILVHHDSLSRSHSTSTLLSGNLRLRNSSNGILETSTGYLTDREEIPVKRSTLRSYSLDRPLGSNTRTASRPSPFSSPTSRKANSSQTSRTTIPAAETNPSVRFIDSVGWCMRLSSGKYKIMFLDGVCLVVDIDDESVNYISKTGTVSR